jgi:hypothetical protein
MADLNFTILGMPELQRRLRRASDEIVKGSVRLMIKAGFDVERDAKLNVHVMTGFLRNHINTRTQGNGLDTTVTIGTKVVYARREEMLRSHTPARIVNTKKGVITIPARGPDHSFLRPAFARVTSRFTKQLRELLNLRAR